MYLCAIRLEDHSNGLHPPQAELLAANALELLVCRDHEGLPHRPRRVPNLDGPPASPGWDDGRLEKVKIITLRGHFNIFILITENFTDS